MSNYFITDFVNVLFAIIGECKVDKINVINCHCSDS